MTIEQKLCTLKISNADSSINDDRKEQKKKKTIKNFLHKKSHGTDRGKKRGTFKTDTNK